MASVALSALVLGGFSVPLGSLPPLGSLLDPTSGLWPIAFGNRQWATQTISVPGLANAVTVVRDRTGVPHIYAKDAHDGWFALGYVHALDRLWQMDTQYRFAAGRLSEVLGPEYVASDEFYRTIGLERIAEDASVARAAAHGLDAEVVDAYTAGVNAYIASLAPADYPLEYKLLGYAPEPWSPEKILTEGGLVAWLLMGNFNDLTLNLAVERFGAQRAEELFPSYPAGTQYPIQPAAADPSATRIAPAAVEDILQKAAAATKGLPDLAGIGSNNWAVLGTRTATGKPLLAADPHLSFQLPSIWYQAELRAPPYEVRGATFPGIPGFFFGTNGKIAWGETNTGADVEDFFVETLNAAGTQYLYKGAWLDLTVYDEPIRVRGGTVVPFQVKATRHGPILTESGQTVAMESTLGYYGGELEAMLGINLAQDSDHFNASAKSWRVPAQNIIYADANGTYGNIGLRSTGLFPIRSNFSGRLPVNGSTGQYEWTGWVPFDSYPHVWDPPEGFVTSTNQVPAPPDYPYIDSLGQFFDPGYRSRRIHDLLASNDHVTFADLRSYQQDVYDVAAVSIVPYVVQAVSPADELHRAAYDALRTWDYQATNTSVAATVWNAFMGRYLVDTYGDEYRAADATDVGYPQYNTLENLTVHDPTSHWFDNTSTATVETRDSILRQAFNEAVDDLANRLGPVVASWTWGSVHTRTFPHLSGLGPLSRGPYASPGDSFTLNVAGGLTSEFGPSWRQLIDFSNLDGSLAIYPGGESGDPLSPHYDDFLPVYMRGDYLSFRGYADPSALQGLAESTLTLAPG